MRNLSFILAVAVAVVLAVAACGDNSTTPGEPGGDLVADLSVRTVATIAPDSVRGLALATLPDERLAVARIETTGDAFCPDCTMIEPSQCPAACERAVVSVNVLDPVAGTFDAARTIATVFPADHDRSVDQVAIVALDAARVGVAWLDCDNAQCGGVFAKRSCDAHYATLDLATGAVGAAQTLYTGRFGDLSLGYEPTSHRLLALVGKDLAFGSGVFGAVFDDTGAVVRSPWHSLGSPAMRSPAILAARGALVVVADDWSPNAPAPAPCHESCDCLSAGPIDIAAGGLFAYRITDDGPEQVERIAAGTDAAGFYGSREQISVIDAGGRALVATTQSIDRSAELFAYDAGAWVERMRVPAPIPTWIGALGTADRSAWIGAQPEPGASATVQRLVAGVVADGAEQRATFTEPADRSVFATAPVTTALGVTTTYVLQGLFVRDGGMLGWDRFEILAIDAAW